MDGMEGSRRPSTEYTETMRARKEELSKLGVDVLRELLAATQLKVFVWGSMEGASAALKIGNVRVCVCK